MSQSRRAVARLSEWRKPRRAKQTQLLRLMTSQGLRRRLTSGQGKMRSVSGRRRGGHEQRSLGPAGADSINPSEGLRPSEGVAAAE